MWTNKEILIFLAGAETFHTITHIFLNLIGALPIRIFSITLDKRLNFIAIVINVLITIGLFWWISTL